MEQPNYNNCSLDELHRVLELIDQDAWPDRVARIESIINDPKNLKKTAGEKVVLGKRVSIVLKTAALFLLGFGIASMMAEVQVWQ